MTTTPFFDRLEAVRAERNTTLCVGIDPRLERIPDELRSDDVEATLTRFGIEILELTAPHAACWKANIGFFEAHGLAGLRAYAALTAEARSKGLLLIGDVKRGDIGSTAQAYAKAHLAPGSDLEVDAITVSPYLGADALAPFIDASAANGKGIYVLVRTSNPGAKDLQDRALAATGALLHEQTAALVAELGEATVSVTTGLSSVGAVVGATGPDAAAALRKKMPHTPFLVPGYGAQGGTAADVAVCYRENGSGAVINASRSVTHPPAPDGDWRAAVAAAAQAAQEDLYGACLA